MTADQLTQLAAVIPVAIGAMIGLGVTLVVDWYRRWHESKRLLRDSYARFLASLDVVLHRLQRFQFDSMENPWLIQDEKVISSPAHLLVEDLKDLLSCAHLLAQVDRSTRRRELTRTISTELASCVFDADTRSTQLINLVRRVRATDLDPPAGDLRRSSHRDEERGLAVDAFGRYVESLRPYIGELKSTVESIQALRQQLEGEL